MHPLSCMHTLQQTGTDTESGYKERSMFVYTVQWMYIIYIDYVYKYIQ